MNEKNFEFLLYSSADEEVSVNALVKDETIWLTQKAMADLQMENWRKIQLPRKSR